MIILCIKIFLVRIIDVSLGTIKTIYIVKNKKLKSALFGFCEVFIWFMIAREALNTSGTNIYVALAYAGGYATGTYLGGFISQKFIIGNFTIQVITKEIKLVQYLRDSGFGVTAVNIENDSKYKQMLFIEIYKRHYFELKKAIKKFDPEAFIVTNETYSVSNGYLKK